MYTNAQAALMAAVQTPRTAYTPTVETLSDGYLAWLNAQDTPKAAQPLTGAEPFNWHYAREQLLKSDKINTPQLRQFDRYVNLGKLAQAESFYTDVMNIEQGYDVDEMRAYMNTHPHVRHDTMLAFMQAITAQDYEAAYRLYKLAQDTQPTDA